MGWNAEMTSDKFDFELLMTRRLDGAISDEESLALDRELLRNPELHATFDRMRQIDVLASAALSRECGRAGRAVDVAAITTPRRSVRFTRPHRGWFLIPGAIAAALLALVIPVPRFQQQPEQTPMSVVPVPQTNGGGHPGLVWPNQHVRPVMTEDGLLRNVSTTRRNTGRDVMGVIGDDGNIYWIEVDRSRTIKVPPRTPKETFPRL